MAEYIAQRIIDGALDYAEVVVKYPTFKEKIDTYLIDRNHNDLIVK